MSFEKAADQKKSIALVLGQVPTTDEIDQYRSIAQDHRFVVITAASIAQYLQETSYFKNLNVMALPDQDENPTYLPGLEKTLANFDVVLLKERLGLYAYQVLKAKGRYGFKMVVIVDNAMPFAGQDINQMRIIRSEVTRSSDAFLVYSEVARTSLRLEAVDQERIFKLVPTVDRHVTRNHQNRLKARATLKLAESDFVVGYAGQIEWEESLFDLAESVRIACDEDASMNRRIRLVFCGVGSALTDLRARLRHLKLEDRALFVAPGRDAMAAVYLASDAYFHAPIVSRDRLDAEPYRILGAMVNKLPIIAHRTPVVEEMIGKHRIDFCSSSRKSLVEALHKASDAKALIGNIVAKNLSEIEKRYSKDRATLVMQETLSKIFALSSIAREVSLDQEVAVVEAKVQAQLYLEAIDLIEPMVQRKDLPIYHRANLYRLIGDCLLKLDDEIQAKTSYVRALELDPFLAKAHIGLGVIAIRRQAFDAAILTFQKAVNFAPEDDMANLGLALAFEGLGDLKEAGKWAKLATQLNPRNTPAIFTLVKISHDRKVFTDARMALCRYIEANPSDANMIYALAGVEYSDGQADVAERVCQELLALVPGDERALQLLAQIKDAKNSGASQNVANSRA